MAATAYNKMGNGGVGNYLYVIGKRNTYLFGWNAMYNGPDVFSCIKLAGRINPARKGYTKAEPVIVRAVIGRLRQETEEFLNF